MAINYVTCPTRKRRACDRRIKLVDIPHHLNAVCPLPSGRLCSVTHLLHRMNKQSMEYMNPCHLSSSKKKESLVDRSFHEHF